jgi:catechol 2,3-dioxygenase-like lactoylglutathione lyase family enzyme
MGKDWFARAVLFVADVPRSLDFYVNRLRFEESWRYEEDGKTVVAGVERDGCALICSSQWPDKIGKGLMFISLDGEALGALRSEFQGAGVAVSDGWWGYRLMVVRDPDGNELYFPYPNEGGPNSREAPDKAANSP